MKEKTDVTFRDDYDDAYGDGVILTCFENRLPECLQVCHDFDASNS